MFTKSLAGFLRGRGERRKMASSEESLGSSPSSLLGSTDSERSSQPEEDVRMDTDYEDKGKEGGDTKLLGNRRRHWYIYRNVDH